jgi:hypothetical protein
MTSVHGQQIAVEQYRHPDEFPVDVQRFFLEAEKISIELGSTWFRNLIDTVYPLDRGVRFYVLRHDGRPVAALPLLVTAQWGGKQVRSLANYYSALFAPVLDATVKAADLVPMLRAIIANEGPIESFRFIPMDPESDTYRRLLEALKIARLVPFPFFSFGNWYLRVNSDWAQYLAERKGTLRNTIKRMGKKLTADEGRLEIVQDAQALDRAIDAYEQVYARSWKVPEPYPAFVPGLIRTCSQNGWLRLGIAWLGEKPIASQIWIVAKGKASIYKVAYDEAYKQYAPGTLVTALLMEQALDQDRVAEVDYLIGDDKYKQTWMNHRRERWGVVAYNPRNIRGLYSMAREIAGRSLRRILAKLRSKLPRREVVGDGAGGGKK